MDGDDLAELTTPTFSAEAWTVHLAATLTAAPVTSEMWAYQQGSSGIRPVSGMRLTGP